MDTDNMIRTYEEMLDKAYAELPEASKEEVRFEIPTVQRSLAGNKTVVTDLQQVAVQLRRPVEHLHKFLLRELATTGEMKARETIFVGRFRSEQLNEKIYKYAKEFVMCHQCGKPDTTLKKEAGTTLLICEACGAKASVRTIK